jgi:hypothetical protein
MDQDIGHDLVNRMSGQIGHYLIREYNRPSITIEVNEDGENGSIVEIYE